MLDLLPATSAQRVEAAVRLPRRASLEFSWRGQASGQPPKEIELWVHSFDGPARRLAAIPFAVSASTQRSSVALDIPAGTVCLLRLTAGATPIDWISAHLVGEGGEPSSWRIRPSEGAPNVAIAVIDALRADVIGAYGGPGPTPVLDRLAADGLLFERAYSPSTWTRPAVASLFTGLSAAAHGVVSEDFSLPEGAFTLAERFRLQGYRTIGVVANGHISNAFNFDQGFETYLWEPDSVTASDRASGVRVDYADSRAVFDTALARLPTAADGRPVFFYLHTVDAHEPYSPPEWLLPEPKPEMAANVYLQRLINQGEAATPRLLEDFALLYRGGVAYSDRELGHFLDAMDERLGEEGTIVVATADHGEAFFEHRFVGHSSWPFEELARVPLILSGPGIPRGRRETALASLLDVLPTVAPRGQASGMPELRTQGVDLLTGSSAMAARAVVSESAEGLVLVSGEWKLSYRPSYPEPLQYRLHNLRNDRLERVDLSSSEPVVMDQLKLQLRGYQQDSKRLALEPLARPARIDQELVDNLKALGYVR